MLIFVWIGAGLIFLSLGTEPVYSVEVEQANIDQINTNKIFIEQNKTITKASAELFGIDPNNKFSLYRPTYFIFGEDNLKLQFSAKYRAAKSYNLYLAFTQTMFWNIYDESSPFDDINYSPEVFYRLVQNEKTLLRSIDVGILHTSNGEDGGKSRSMNRALIKTNFATTFRRHNIFGELIPEFFKIYVA